MILILEINTWIKRMTFPDKYLKLGIRSLF